MKVLGLVLTLLAVYAYAQTAGDLASDVSLWIGHHSETAGYSAMGQVLDEQILTKTSIGGIIRANDLAASVNGRLRTWASILQSVVDEIDGKFGDPRSLDGIPTFLNSEDDPFPLALSPDSRFNGFNTSREDTVLKIPNREQSRFDSIDINDPIFADLLLQLFATGELGSLFESNLDKNVGLLNQYYGSEEGFLSYFPASEFPSGDYDPRKEPWYAEAVSGAKAVVIALDITEDSNPVDDTWRAYIKAAKAVVHVLGSSDYVAVLPYGDKTIESILCETIDRELIRASAANKARLIEFLDDIEAAGPVDESPNHPFVMEEAVKRFDSTVLNPNKPLDCSFVVVFLTNDEDISNDDRLDIADANDDSELNIDIFVYQTTDEFNQFAQRIACESEGLYEYNISTSDLPLKAARFYTLYANSHAPDSPKYRVGVGLRPDMNLGTVVTAVQPIYVPKGIGLFDFIGVAAIEFTLTDLGTVFEQVNTGLSFGMLLTDQAEVIIHPNIPQAIQSESLFDIRNIEASPSFFGVRGSIAERDSGSRSASVLRLAFEGGIEGISVIYDFTPVPDSPFYIVLSSDPNDVDQISFQLGNNFGSTSYYARHVLTGNSVPGQMTDAFRGGQITTDQASSFLMAQSLWFDPLSWLSTPDTSALVTALEDFVNSVPGSQNPGLFPSFREHVQISGGLDDVYMFGPVQSPGTVWRYLGYIDGTFSIFPGRLDVAEEYKAYDPRSQDWYLRAVNNAGVGTVGVSTPTYDGEDRFGSLREVISVSKAVEVEGVLLGVVGIDLDYDVFHSEFIGFDGDCDMADVECALVNFRGELVVHESFRGTPITGPVFMGAKYPEITAALIADGAWVLEDVEFPSEGLIKKFYVASSSLASGVSASGTVSTTDCDSGDYSVAFVPDTNLFVLKITNYALNSAGCLGLTDPLVSPPAPDVYVLDACVEARLDSLLPVGPGECPAYTYSVSFIDDELRTEETECEDLEEFKEIIWIGWDSWPGILIAIITFFLLILAVAILIFLIVFNKHPVIRSASPLFCYLIMAGIILGYIAVFFFIGEPHISLCVIRPVLVTFAWVIVYANLLAKTWRIWRVFSNAKSMKRTKIKNWQLLIVVAVGMLIQAVILIFWLAADTPEPTEIDNQFDDNEEFRTCKSDIHYLWVGIEIAYFGLMMLVGAILAFRVRNVATAYNESKWIALSIYNILFISIFAVPAVYALWEFPEVHFLIKTLAMLLVLTGTELLLFGPKIYNIIRNAEDTRHDSTYGSGSSGSGSSSQNSTVKIDSGTLDDDDSTMMDSIDDDKL